MGAPFSAVGVPFAITSLNYLKQIFVSRRIGEEIRRDLDKEHRQRGEAAEFARFSKPEITARSDRRGERGPFRVSTPIARRQSSPRSLRAVNVPG